MLLCCLCCFSPLPHATLTWRALRRGHCYLSSHYMYYVVRRLDCVSCCALRSRRITPNVAAVCSFFLGCCWNLRKTAKTPTIAVEDMKMCTTNSPRVAHHKEMRRKKTGRSDGRTNEIMRRNIRPQISGGTRLGFPAECTGVHSVFLLCFARTHSNRSQLPPERDQTRKSNG